MTNVDLEIGIAKLISDKLDKNYECSVDDSVIKETFFVKSYDRGQTYTLYRGCNTVIGDVPLNYLIGTLSRLHIALTKNMKKIFIGPWNGIADVFVLEGYSILPEGCRYICTTDDDLNIYESLEGVVYGVAAM